MAKEFTASDCFVAGIQALRSNGWMKMKQKDLAKNIGYTPSHLSQVFNGNREAGPALQEALAKAFEMRLEDVLRIGRLVLEGKGFLPFVGQIDHLKPNSEEQASAIIELTNRKYGIDGFLAGYRPGGWNKFISGEITAGQFYQEYAHELNVLVAAISKKHGAVASGSKRAAPEEDVSHKT